jgi:hypothetical protein
MTLAKTALYWLQGECALYTADIADMQNGTVVGVWLDITRQPSSGVCGRRRMGGSADGQLMCS